MISQKRDLMLKRKVYHLASMNATYSCPRFIASPSVYSFSQLPCEIVSPRGENRLRNLGGSYQQVGVGIRRESEAPGYQR